MFGDLQQTSGCYTYSPEHWYNGSLGFRIFTVPLPLSPDTQFQEGKTPPINMFSRERWKRPQLEPQRRDPSPGRTCHMFRPTALPFPPLGEGTVQRWLIQGSNDSAIFTASSPPGSGSDPQWRKHDTRVDLISFAPFFGKIAWCASFETQNKTKCQKHTCHLLSIVLETQKPCSCTSSHPVYGPNTAQHAHVLAAEGAQTQRDYRNTFICRSVWHKVMRGVYPHAQFGLQIILLWIISLWFNRIVLMFLFPVCLFLDRVKTSNTRFTDIWQTNDTVP